MEKLVIQKQFIKGDYIFLTERTSGIIKKEVFLVCQNWVHVPGRTFNALRVNEVATGKERGFTGNRLKDQVQLLPKKEIPKYKKQIEERVKRLQDQDKEILKQVEESLQAIFPNNWDLVKNKSLTEPYVLIIKFPMFEIINGQGTKHLIQDLYVKWVFKKGFVISKPLSGIRGLVDYVEYKSGYVHSHLPNVNYTSSRDLIFSTFCMGSGDFAIANLEWACDDRQFTQEAFELLLYQLDAYVKWESLQGGPYMRMENIAIGGRSRYLDSHEIRRSFEIVIKELKQFPLKFDNVKNRFKVELFLLEPILSIIKDIYKIQKTSGGDYIFGDISRNSIEDWIAEGNKKGSKEFLFIFKGEKIFFKVKELDKKYNDSQLLEVPHPDITKYVAQELTRKTNHYFINKYGV